EIHVLRIDRDETDALGDPAGKAVPESDRVAGVIDTLVARTDLVQHELAHMEGEGADGQVVSPEQRDERFRARRASNLHAGATSKVVGQGTKKGRRSGSIAALETQNTNSKFRIPNSFSPPRWCAFSRGRFP